MAGNGSSIGNEPALPSQHAWYLAGEGSPQVGPAVAVTEMVAGQQVPCTQPSHAEAECYSVYAYSSFLHLAVYLYMVEETSQWYLQRCSMDSGAGVGRK